jgi:hypothetical protein
MKKEEKKKKNQWWKAYESNSLGPILLSFIASAYASAARNQRLSTRLGIFFILVAD